VLILLKTFVFPLQVSSSEINETNSQIVHTKILRHITY
jgi:hypothetical protein